MRKVLTLMAGGALLLSCKQPQAQNALPLTSSDAAMYTIEEVVPDLNNPWGMAWLPDGSMLITEKSGSLIHFKDGNKTEIKGVPDIYVRGQGGFLDVELHPNYAESGWIYFTHASD